MKIKDFDKFFDEVIEFKFDKALERQDFWEDELTLLKKGIISEISCFLLEKPVFSLDDFRKRFKNIKEETLKKVVDILRHEESFKEFSKKLQSEVSKEVLEIISNWSINHTNLKVIKYLWDDWILKEEKRPNYVNSFAEYIIDSNDFFWLLPDDIKKHLSERLLRFIWRQEDFKKQEKFNEIQTLDQYYHFLWSKISFPKVWVRLILKYYENNWFIKTSFDEVRKNFEIKLTEKWTTTSLWLNDNSNDYNEYSKIEWDLKERIIKMIHKNLIEWEPRLDQIKNQLFEEWIMVHKKDLKILLSEILQIIASKQSSKSVIQKLNEEIREEKNYEVFWWVYQFIRKEVDIATWEKKERVYSIPVSEVDQIFMSYSRYWQNLTQQQVMYKFEISKEVWSLLKTRLSFTKDSLPVSPYTLENFSKEELNSFNEKLWNELIRDEFRKALIDEQEKIRNREFNRMKKILSWVDHFLEHLEDYIKTYKPRDFWFREILDKKREYTNEYITVSFWDLHLWKQNTDDVINRVKKLFKLIEKYPQKNVCLIWLWDFFENIVEWWMHPGQIESMDWPYWFELIMLFVNLIEEMIYNLVRSWKEVSFYSVWWNHDRFWKWHNEDIKRTAHLVSVEMIKRGLSNIDAEIRAFKEKTNSFWYWNFHYIINHWDDWFSKKAKSNPEDILWKYWNNSAWIHNIIKFWHEHHWYLWETKDATIIWTPSLAWKWEYDTRLWFFSESWIIVIEENEDNLPDVSFKRLK